ncbi:MAG TPA: hypothetical protein VFU47_03235, partial [Armatimonadota bacterium]|nr:hypothetical protein [Armatimonadota bacterium]
AAAYANVPQEVRIFWHVNRGGQAVLTARDAWNPDAEWKELGSWDGEPKRGEATFSIASPTLLRLRARAPRFPRSGIASLKLEYSRHTVAVLRGTPEATKRPVILAEGYDPFNVADLNDPAGQPAFARFITAGRARYRLDPWLLDWGDGGAPLEQQAEDFAEIARQVRAWNGDRAGTVAAGISMGAVSLRYALASAAGQGQALGVRKYISINGPHQGAWVNPELREYLLKRARGEIRDPVEDPVTFFIRRGLDSPAAQELLIGAEQHERFYAALHRLGRQGYDPRIPRVAFSNGTLVREGTDLAELVRGNASVVHRLSLRPLWLPLWLTLHKSRLDFRYGAYPGELVPLSLTQPIRTHKRFLGIFRVDLRARWEKIPTFIPTHSALDFPEELTGGPERFRYSRWRETEFQQIYIARNRNLPHDDTSADWIDPKTGKGAPDGQNAVLYEVRQAFPETAGRNE